MLCRYRHQSKNVWALAGTAEQPCSLTRSRYNLATSGTRTMEYINAATLCKNTPIMLPTFTKLKPFFCESVPPFSQSKWISVSPFLKSTNISCHLSVSSSEQINGEASYKIDIYIFHVRDDKWGFTILTHALSLCGILRHSYLCAIEIMIPSVFNFQIMFYSITQ